MVISLQFLCELRMPALVLLGAVHVATSLFNLSLIARLYAHHKPVVAAVSMTAVLVFLLHLNRIGQFSSGNISVSDFLRNAVVGTLIHALVMTALLRMTKDSKEAATYSKKPKA